MIKTRWTPMALMLSLFVATFVSCEDKETDTGDVAEAKLSIDYEKYELENGLNVVLHQDKSDPIVSVAIQYGVGSNREKKGRTGFAHLFEHMLFQESENVPQDQFFKTIQDAWGTLNGCTLCTNSVQLTKCVHGHCRGGFISVLYPNFGCQLTYNCSVWSSTSW